MELKGTRDGLIAAGFSIVLASSETGPCVGKYDGNETADIAMKDVQVADYDRIAFIGGPGAFALVEDEEALRIAREAAASNMVLGAICIAPKILAAAGVLKGKKATVAPADGTPQQFLIAHDAIFTDEPVVIDGNIITANGPAAAEEFGEMLAGMSVR